MNFTETWLNREIQDEKIPNFTTFRSDRKCSKKRKGGGAAIYVKNGFESRLISADQIGSCEIVAINIENINTTNIVVYRPPDTCYKEFERVMNKIELLLSMMESPEPTVIITGTSISLSLNGREMKIEHVSGKRRHWITGQWMIKSNSAK